MPEENDKSTTKSLVEKITMMQMAVTFLGLGLMAAITWFIVSKGDRLTDDGIIRAFVTFLLALGLLTVILIIALHFIFRNIDTSLHGESTGRQFAKMFTSLSPITIVATLVGLLIIGSIVWFIVNGGQVFDSAEKARGLITFAVAIVTVGIAVILVSFIVAATGDPADIKERFAFGKDVLMVFVGILGTIMGFYYGSTEKVAPDDIRKIAGVVQNRGTTPEHSEWVIVAGTDVSRDQAQVELEKALSVSEDAKVYKVGNQFRTVIPGFASVDAATQVLPKAQQVVNQTSYVLELKTWCKDPKPVDNYIECQPVPTPTPK